MTTPILMRKAPEPPNCWMGQWFWVTVGSTGDLVQNVGQSVVTNFTTGETGLVIVVQINGVVVGFTSTIPLVSGDELEMEPWVGSPQTIPYVDLDITLPCFTRGTLILTPAGNVAVEAFSVGDMVITADHGAQPIRWIGMQRVVALGRQAPVRLQAGALGNTRALTVSPMHRILVTGWRAELLFGLPEVLVPASALVNGDTICRVPVADVAYYHIMFEGHEIIYAEGCASESFAPESEALGLFGAAARAELDTLFPQLAQQPWPDARPTITSAETAILRQYS